MNTRAFGVEELSTPQASATEGGNAVATAVVVGASASAFAAGYVVGRLGG